MKHNPWMKFYPQDWLTDVELRSCSSAARGTLIDLICLAHRQENYGVCMADNTVETRKKTAKCLSLTLRTFDSHLASLIQMKRICVADDGRLYIKRMVQDHDYSLRQSKIGKMGGNPTLKPEKSKRREEKKERREETLTMQQSLRVAERLFESILSWKPDHKRPTPAQLRKWAEDIDKAIRIDGRTEGNLTAIIDWLPSHEGSNGFRWRDQIRSGKKLREKYDQLDTAMNPPQEPQLRSRFDEVAE